MSVRAWEEPVVIPTYPVPPPDRNPMFLEKRVYQGSSGKVYPLPVTDRVSDTKIDRTWRAVWLENEYIRLMLLPEIGGRIHIGQDKSNGYDFFYRQTVIKPALVGLLGPWISGGVEFNWPQHHRPTTFMPVEHRIEEHADGSRTVWMGEHEPMNRTKGMVGICLHPGKAFVETKVQIYNRTPFVQTFLWWANAGVHVHDEHEAFFPPDVTFVADHARRAMTEFPIARGRYYGVDYSPGTDLRWYKNIPVPTSYMVTRSEYDFAGGYDHRRRAGLVHYADHRIAPGKKLWTWGNHEFGYAWDRELTDSGGPYVELMAGCFTDNQPDFSWLAPYETRTFSQYWYPIREIGPVKNANREAAFNLELRDGQAHIGICVTEPIPAAAVLLYAAGELICEIRTDLHLARPFLHSAAIPAGAAARALRLELRDSHGRLVLSYMPEAPAENTAPPAPAAEPPQPREMESNEALYLAGVHLDQYRHATRLPEPYWQEAIRRNPEDWRSHNALGLSALRAGLFRDAERHFRAAVAALTRWNQNPRDGESHYNLGIALRYQGRLEEAYAPLEKAAWSYAWQSAACYALAEIDCRLDRHSTALDQLDRSLAVNTRHMKARNLRCAILRAAGSTSAAAAFARESLALDPLDGWARVELALVERAALPDLPEQTALDIAFDYAAVGFWADAIRLAERFPESAAALYPLAWFHDQAGQFGCAAEIYACAAAASGAYYFPSRLEEMVVLESAPPDARAPYYLGCLLYDKRRYKDAIRNWELAAERAPAFPTVWRNLGIAYCNVLRQPDRALAAYSRAFAADPSDARILYEYDQLRKWTGVSPPDRLAMLERHRDLVDLRDDLSIELAALYNDTGRPARALDLIAARRFHPWEGGEGKVSGEYVRAHIALGREALAGGNPETALSHFDAAMIYPGNLGEGKHLLTPENHLYYYRGLALEAMGRNAVESFLAAAEPPSAISETTAYQAMALRKLGDTAAANERIAALRAHARQRLAMPPQIEFFATSLPNFLLFEDDLDARNRAECVRLLELADRAEADAAQETHAGI